MKALNAWLDSTVALHWIKGAGEYKQFVGNRVRKIKEIEPVEWRHAPTLENPADLASRGGPVNNEISLWWEGPTWLKDPESWPPDIVTTATRESDEEAKVTKQIFALAVHEADAFDDLLSRRTLWRTLRVGAWNARFLHNARAQRGKRITDPLSTEEIEKQKFIWEKRVQTQCVHSEQFQEDKLKLNLQINQDGLLECRGRIQGDYPIYLPDRQSYFHREAGTTRPRSHSTWGSWFNHGQSTRDTLGT